MLIQIVTLQVDRDGDYIEFYEDGFQRCWACAGEANQYIRASHYGDPPRTFEIHDEEIPDAIKLHLGSNGHHYFEVNDVRLMDNDYKSELPSVHLYDNLRRLLESCPTIWVKEVI